MKLLKPRLLPLVAACAVVGLIVAVGKWQPRHPRADAYGVLGSGRAGDGELCEGYPWDGFTSDAERVLNVVVEEEGVYIGDECIPYVSFRAFLIKNAKRWRPHHAIIRGRIDGRFGHGAAVYQTLWSLGIWPRFDTMPGVARKRYPAVELHRFGMPLEEWEQMEKGASAPR